MQAIAKLTAAPGLNLVDVPEPSTGPGQVKIKLEAASVCGTDLHIYQWDAWSASRVRPPRVIGHEFCGTIIEVGEGVAQDRIGEFVSSESHIVAPNSIWLAAGLGHLDPETQLLGVDTDGGFAEFAVVPEANARTTSRSIPKEIACFQDALGNAVHTALAGPIEDCRVLITGAGPIGLFAVAVCRAAGASEVIVSEISPYRRGLAEQLGADVIVNPTDGNVNEKIGTVDVALEMSGNAGALATAVDRLRAGGRLSLLGLHKDKLQPVPINDIIFKGLLVQGIVGRKLWETWDQMSLLLGSGLLNVAPVITHQMPFTEFEEAMSLMSAGQAGKVVFTFP